MKTTHGACFLASAKRSLILAAPLPTKSSTNSDAAAAKNGTPASPATAFAASSTNHCQPVIWGSCSVSDWSFRKDLKALSQALEIIVIQR